jgi:hypothetical protein
MLHDASMKTESKFAGVNLDLIKNVVFHLHFEEIIKDLK